VKEKEGRDALDVKDENVRGRESVPIRLLSLPLKNNGQGGEGVFIAKFAAGESKKRGGEEPSGGGWVCDA